MKILSSVALGLILGLLMLSRAAAHSVEELREDEPYLQLTNSAVPDFALEDAWGRKTSLADYRGKVVVLNFIYARCKEQCPLQSRLLAKIQAQINSTPMRDQVQLVSVATDTEDAARTAEIMRGYGKAMGFAPANWVFLYRGAGAPDAGINAAKSYGLEFVPLTREQIHAVVTHVIDRQGVMRARFHGLRFEPEHLTEFVNTLVFPDHDEGWTGTAGRALLRWWKTPQVRFIGLLVLGLSLLVSGALVLRREWLRYHALPAGADRRPGADEARQADSVDRADA